MKIIDTRPLPDGTEAVIIELPGIGRTCLVMPTIPDAAPDEVREGIARRRLVYLTDDHQCPCGARWTLPNRRQRRTGSHIVMGTVEHKPGCPACDDALDAAILRWKRGAR